MHFVLFYTYGPDYLTAREPYRAEHLALLKAAHERGELVLAGALNSPPDGAAIIFRGDTTKAAEEVVKSDPYVKHGVVKKWEIQPYQVVIGQ